MGQPQPKNHYSEEEMRREIIDTIPQLDKSFLRIVHSMMRTYAEELDSEETKASREGADIEDPIIDYTIDGKPIREKEFFDSMDKDVEEARAGASRPIDEFFKEKEEWLKNIK